MPEKKVMALINCPECKHEVSDKAKYCPNCGYKICIGNNAPFISKLTDIILRKPIIFCLCIGLIICSIVFIKWENADNDNYSSSNNYTPSTYSSNEKTDASSIFKNLKISNFSASLGQHGGKMSCEVLNNNAFTVRGYFYVGFYDKSGNLMYSQLMSLPSVASGEEVICSTLIPKDDYPTGYSYVKYTQASLVKD